MLFRRTILSDRQEAAVQKTLQHLRAQRRNRFRILACIDGTEDALVTVRFAARYSVQDNCDLIVLFVRPIDSALSSGGLDVGLAREHAAVVAQQVGPTAARQQHVEIAVGIDVADRGCGDAAEQLLGDGAAIDRHERRTRAAASCTPRAR